ncbi:MAG: competence/damage-inducible protein A [Ruminococcaceae bacterium]|nr:competence/damage-inducible protein A [Oscillospiraceae bacterium]
MNAELISVGTELLLGEIVNTNAQYISTQLAVLGISVYYQTTVGDNRDRLLSALSAAFERSDIVILTGGLGPTADDITKEMVADFFGLKLVRDNESEQRIKDYFKRINSNAVPSNFKQADMPEECIILENNNGTAPGGIIEKDGKIAVFLPGPPSEMKPMFEESVFPFLREKSPERLYSREINTFGIGESKLEEMLKPIMTGQTDPTIAPYAKDSGVMLRLTTKAKTEEEANRRFDPVEEQIRKIAGDIIYGYGAEELQDSVYKLLKEKNLKIATAESCTGGMLGEFLTSVPGISEFYEMGVITYSNDMKIKLLGVSAQTLDEYGAVSEQTAKEMASGVLRVSGADIGVGITGIAGPGGGSEEKPVGLVYVGIADSKGGVECRRLTLAGNRDRIRRVTVKNALNAVRLKIADF